MMACRNGRRFMGVSMRKSALLLAVLMVAAAPATALAAKKKAGPVDPNANAKKFVTSAAQQPVHIWNGLWSPWWAARK
jgi:hypothetical protein